MSTDHSHGHAVVAASRSGTKGSLRIWSRADLDAVSFAGSSPVAPALYPGLCVRTGSREGTPPAAAAHLPPQDFPRTHTPGSSSHAAMTCPPRDAMRLASSGRDYSKAARSRASACLRDLSVHALRPRARPKRAPRSRGWKRSATSWRRLLTVPSRPSVVVGGTDAVFEVVADDDVEVLVVECFVDGR
jgi:hypothetical protein